LLHFEVAVDEEEATWTTFFNHLIARGLDPKAVKLIVSDGSKGVLATINKLCLMHSSNAVSPIRYAT
jgi:transposase-like protein